MLDDKYKSIQKKYDIVNLASMSDQELIDAQKEVIQSIGYYRSLELTTKRLANSVYGAFGTNSNRYFLQALAEDICAEGRYYLKLMDTTQNDYFTGKWTEEAEFIEELKSQSFGHVIPESLKVPKLINNKNYVNYGDTDSVAKDSMIRTTSGIKTIEQFYNDNICNGSAGETSAGHESVLTNDKVLNYEDSLYYAKVKRIIRHKVTKAKWRLVTKSGQDITVTNDHSMIVFRDGQQIECKPSEILNTDKILCIRGNKLDA